MRLLILVFLLPGIVFADEGKISIIFDDIGYRIQDDMEAVNLDGPFTYAVMPYSLHGNRISKLILKNGKDILIHIPMEPENKRQSHFLGPGALKLKMDQREFIRVLTKAIVSMPHAVGVNNHMGSLLTRHHKQMTWVMATLRFHNKFFVDSYTSRDSVAMEAAKLENVPCLKRDIFLDNEKDPAYIQAQLNELIRIAKKKGFAIGIGHPRPETISVLSENLPLFASKGVKIVKITDLIKKNPLQLVNQ